MRRRVGRRVRSRSSPLPQPTPRFSPWQGRENEGDGVAVDTPPLDREEVGRGATRVPQCRTILDTPPVWEMQAKPTGSPAALLYRRRCAGGSGSTPAWHVPSNRPRPVRSPPARLGRKARGTTGRAPPDRRSPGSVRRPSTAASFGGSGRSAAARQPDVQCGDMPMPHVLLIQRYLLERKRGFDQAGVHTQPLSVTQIR